MKLKKMKKKDNSFWLNNLKSPCGLVLKNYEERENVDVDEMGLLCITQE